MVMGIDVVVVASMTTWEEPKDSSMVVVPKRDGEVVPETAAANSAKAAEAMSWRGVKA